MPCSRAARRAHHHTYLRSLTNSPIRSALPEHRHSLTLGTQSICQYRRGDLAAEGNPISDRDPKTGVGRTAGGGDRSDSGKDSKWILPHLIHQSRFTCNQQRIAQPQPGQARTTSNCTRGSFVHSLFGRQAEAEAEAGLIVSDTVLLQYYTLDRVVCTGWYLRYGGGLSRV
jgi:hypothetical protein